MINNGNIGDCMNKINEDLKSVLMIIAGSTIFAISFNKFIIPLNLFSGGGLGLAQLINNALGYYLKTELAMSGIINLLINIPLFIIAYKLLSKRFCFTTLLSILTQSIVLSLVSIPKVPIMDDILASCVIGGIGCGVGVGIVLLTRASSGGVDIIGMYLSKKFKSMSVGKVTNIFNFILFSVCAYFYDLPTAIYSIIFCCVMSFVVDKIHLQNIEVSLMIFTKNKQVKKMIMKDFIRGITYWNGLGGYTDSETDVLVTVVSKYEILAIKRNIIEMDKDAFIIINENLKVAGSFEKRIL